jgi:hypothetical protein
MPIHNFPLAVKDGSEVTCFLPDSELDGGPLVVRNEEQGGLVLLRVIGGVEVKACIVLLVEVEHEDPFYKEQVAFISGCGICLGPALTSICVNSHR